MRACAGATLARESTNIIRMPPRTKVATPQAHASLLLVAVRAFPGVTRVGIISAFRVGTSANNGAGSCLVELGRELAQPSSLMLGLPLCCASEQCSTFHLLLLGRACSNAGFRRYQQH